MKYSTATADVSDTSDKDRYWSFVCWSRIYSLPTPTQKKLNFMVDNFIRNDEVLWFKLAGYEK